MPNSLVVWIDVCVYIFFTAEPIEGVYGRLLPERLITGFTPSTGWAWVLGFLSFMGFVEWKAEKMRPPEH